MLICPEKLFASNKFEKHCIHSTLLGHLLSLGVYFAELISILRALFHFSSSNIFSRSPATGRSFLCNPHLWQNILWKTDCEGWEPLPVSTFKGLQRETHATWSWMAEKGLPDQAGVWILALSLTSHVPLSKSSDLIEPWFLSQVKSGQRLHLPHRRGWVESKVTLGTARAP